MGINEKVSILCNCECMDRQYMWQFMHFNIIYARITLLKIINKINTSQITYNLSNILKLPKQIKNLKQWKHMKTHRCTLKEEIFCCLIMILNVSVGDMLNLDLALQAADR